jgi:hypothetical protein
LESLPSANGPRKFSTFCPVGSLMLPLGEGLEIQRGGEIEIVEPNTTPVHCAADMVLLTEAELQFLLLTPEAAAELRQRIPAFRFFWEETLGLPLPLPGA